MTFIYCLHVLCTAQGWTQHAFNSVAHLPVAYAQPADISQDEVESAICV